MRQALGHPMQPPYKKAYNVISLDKLMMDFLMLPLYLLYFSCLLAAKLRSANAWAPAARYAAMAEGVAPRPCSEANLGGHSLCFAAWAATQALNQITPLLNQRAPPDEHHERQLLKPSAREHRQTSIMSVSCHGSWLRSPPDIGIGC